MLQITLCAGLLVAVYAQDKYSVKCNDFSCRDFSLVKAIRLAKRQEVSITPSVRTAHSDDGMITFDINCEGDQCDALQRSLPLVANKITDALLLTEKIKVQMTFTDFCQNNGTTSTIELECNVILGLAFPSSWYTGGPVRNVLYPQALIKQIGGSLPNQDYYDIIMRFNSGLSWYYPDAISSKASKSTIKRNQTDFSLVALHEMTHGLGMVTLWQSAQPKDASLEAATILVPAGTVEAPINIYDYYLLTSGNVGRWNRFSNSIKNWQVQGAFASDAFQSAVELYKAATTPLQSSFDGLLSIHTPSKFVTGQSLSHIDHYTYAGTSEFLMRPKQLSGESLVNLQGRSPSPYGRQTLKLLKTLGYQVNTDYLVASESILNPSWLLILVSVLLTLQ